MRAFTLCRFSEFVSFHKSVKAEWPIGPHAPTPKLPPKQLKLFGSDLSDKLRKQREELLSDYLLAVCQRKALGVLPVTWHFL